MINLCHYLPADCLDTAWKLKDTLDVEPMPDGLAFTGVPDDDRFTQMTPLLMWALGRVLDGGAKVICPNTQLCRAMEQVDLRLSVSEYAQPYSGIAVIVPTGIVTDHDILLLVAYKRTTGVSLLYPFRRGDALASDTVTLPADLDGTIESRLADRDVSATGMSVEDQAILHRLARIALNLCLFATERGHTVEPPTQKQRRPKTDRIARLNARQARQIDIQDLHLIMRACNPERPPTIGSGSPKALHRRRGHWRSQAYGPGWCERRRIFVESCWVGLKRDGETPFVETVLK